MFLKPPKASTDQRVRSLLQKATRRGFTQTVVRALARLEAIGDKTWVRSRSIVITFEECWPLAATLYIDRELSSKQRALLNVAKGAKQKDAAGLGALAYAYREGDHSMLDCIPDERILRIVSEALQLPAAFFEWAFGQSKSERSNTVLRAAQQYLPAATWQWDRATILAGALLSIIGDMPTIEASGTSVGEFPYWVALDKHTPQGKIALREIAKQVNTSYRQLIWASFYYESACVNGLLPSPWWEAEKEWRLRRAGLSLKSAGDLWTRCRSLIRQYLEAEALSLKELLDSVSLPRAIPTQNDLL
jgi:hypothetical protein